MKRLHVNVAVADLDKSIQFYSTLFATTPSVQKADYAKWMLDDPRVNFSISARGGEAGVDHLGIQVEDETELEDVYQRLQDAERPVLDEGDVACCYAKSKKAWVSDPQGIAWEAFLTYGENTTYGVDGDLSEIQLAGTEKSTCCRPVLADAEAEESTSRKSCC